MPPSIRIHIILSLPLLASSFSRVMAWSPEAARLRLVTRRHHDRRVATATTRFVAKEEVDDEASTYVESRHTGYNVLGTQLLCCCSNVGGSGIGTGFYGNGFCATGDMDMDRHTVCVKVTDEFLAYSEWVGNDLTTPMPQYDFPGLKPLDIWCLGAEHWVQAYNDGKAPRLYLLSTHEKMLDYIPLEILMKYAYDAEEATKVMDKLNSQRNSLDYLLDLERNGLEELMSKECAEGEHSFQ